MSPGTSVPRPVPGGGGFEPVGAVALSVVHAPRLLMHQSSGVLPHRPSPVPAGGGVGGVGVPVAPKVVLSHASCSTENKVPVSC